MQSTLAHTLIDATAEAGPRTALTVPGSVPLTYDQLWTRAAHLAAALDHHGATAGDRVVVQIEKGTDAVALYLACVRRGLVFTPVNTACPAAELAAYIDDADPALVITSPDTSAPRGRSHTTLGPTGGRLAELAESLDPQFAVAERTPDDLAALLFTSGTTGRPKGAMLSNANLVANARALFTVWHWQPDDVLVHCLPLFHVHGLFVALHCALLGASPTLLLPRFEVDAVIDCLNEATVMMGVPTHYSRLLADDRFDQKQCAGVRLFTSGSAPMTEQLHRRFSERTGHHVVERYGMTETGILTSNPYDGDRVPGSVGFALPGIELRVVDDGVVVEPDAPGTIEVRGPNVFAGYWRRPDAVVDNAGWFVTGDIGHQDHSGRVRLEGRAGDMIISGGENIYPKEIELVLDEIPGVVESAVVGVADEDWGEIVTAVLVADDQPIADQVLTAALGDRLARFKHPRHYVWVDGLPRNTMGKVQKHELRNGLADGPLN